MIKMKHKDLSSMAFVMALQKITQQPMDNRRAYKFKKILDAVTVAKKRVSEQYKDNIAKVHGEVDDKGFLVVDETNPYGFKIKESTDMENLKNCLNSFHEQECTLPRDKLTIADFDGMQIAPGDLNALDPILSDEEEPEAVQGTLSAVG